VMEAMELYKTVGDRKGESLCLRFLAECYLAVGKLPTALKVAEQSRQLSTEHGAVIECARIDMIVAKLHIASSNFEAALEKLEAAREVFKEMVVLGNTHYVLNSHLLGICLSQCGDLRMLQVCLNHTPNHFPNTSLDHEPKLDLP